VEHNVQNHPNEGHQFQKGNLGPSGSIDLLRASVATHGFSFPTSDFSFFWAPCADLAENFSISFIYMLK
jgi:hypothetical protein